MCQENQNNVLMHDVTSHDTTMCQPIGDWTTEGVASVIQKDFKHDGGETNSFMYDSQSDSSLEDSDLHSNKK